jgi:hypothetical protein
VRIARVELEAPRHALGALERFYGRRLGLSVEHAATALAVSAGDAELVFSVAEGEARPFCHFALLVPGDRFEAANAWAGGESLVSFDFWDAEACYLHDPAGNIVELIAHRGVGDGHQTGRTFSPEEILGISEVGLVSRAPEISIETLARELGLPLWSGYASGLGFVGRKAHTLVVAREGRGWLPTGRPAEAHPLGLVVEGGRDATALLPEARARVRARS